MTTSKELQVYKGLTTAIKSRARGYWDNVTFDTFNTDGATKSITMSVYDGLNCSTSLTPLGTVKLDFAGTILPYKWDYRNVLSNQKYCFKPAGQNYNVEYETYNNFVKVGDPDVNPYTGIVSGFGSYKCIRLDKVFSLSSASSAEIVLKVNINDITQANCMIGNVAGNISSGGFAFTTVGGSRLLLAGTTNGTTWTTNDYDTGLDLQLGVNYVKMTWSGTDYNFYISTDGVNWTKGNTLTSGPFTDYIMVFGASGPHYPMQGSLDLKESYIKVDNQIWWDAKSTTSYDNVQSYGSPDFNSATGIYKKPNSGSYLKLPEIFAPADKTWEMCAKFTTASTLHADQWVYTGLAGSNGKLPLLGHNDTTFYLLVSTNGSTRDIIVGGTTTVQPNTTYWLKALFTGTQYKLLSSTDGNTWTTEATVDNSTPIYNNTLYQNSIGADNHSSGAWYLYEGVIDLSGFYIKIDDELWWSPGGENIESLAGCTVDYTDDGSATTMNCFALGDTSVVLTEDNDYEGGTYLGTVSIPSHTV